MSTTDVNKVRWNGNNNKILYCVISDMNEPIFERRTKQTLSLFCWWLTELQKKRARIHFVV